MLTCGKTGVKPWLIAACLLASLSRTAHGQNRDPKRPTIGVAFGGGGALGFAHVGVIRWFEEHRVPIDRVAGTSMGGLIGGAYATGMSAAELTRLIETTNWDDVFGATPYRYKSIQRKEDARNYPSRLVLHMRRGIGLPSWLNNGAEVDNLLSRIGAIYAGLPSFDSLPSPFRCVALDLQTGETVVLDRGSLPLAMRATMSIPGVFPPIQIGDRTLVDGGAMDNVPADVAKGMGADVVIAIPVGAVSDTNVAAFSLLGLVQGVVEAMTGANTRRGMKQADIVINPKLTEFSGRDWRKGKELIEEGYRTAEAMKTQLLKLSVDSATWLAYLDDRAARRRTRMPVIAAIEVRGATAGDERLIRRRLRHHVGRPLDIGRVEAEVRELSGLDRYLTVGWDLVERDGGFALLVRARRLPSAPPFLMTTITVQNRTSDEYVFQWASRLLAFDVLTYGSELRLDAALGADASVGAEFRQPIVGGPLFVAVSAIGAHERVNFARNDAIAAQYDNQRLFGQLDIGVTLWRDAEIRAGVRGGFRDGNLRIGDPVLPSLRGPETELRFRGVLDTQDHAVVPSKGVRIVTTGRHVMDSPDPDVPFAIARTNDGLYQAEIEGSGFLSWNERRERVFAVAAGGSSFDGHPFPIDQYVLGLPLRLDAFWLGERRGDYFAALTLGYLRRIGRLPDFLGGPTLAGAWLQGGSAFDDDSDAHIDTQLGVGTLSETLLGPALIGFSFGSGAHRFYVGFGRLFR